MVLRAHPHGVDHEVDPVVDGKGDDFEHVAGLIRAEVEEALLVEAGDDQCVLDGVEEVVIVDPVLPGGVVDLVAHIVSRNSLVVFGGTRLPGSSAEVVEGIGELFLQ